MFKRKIEKNGFSGSYRIKLVTSQFREQMYLEYKSHQVQLFYIHSDATAEMRWGDGGGQSQRLIALMDGKNKLNKEG